MRQFVLILALAVLASASPFRPYREVDWSKIKMKTPKFPPHALELKHPIEEVEEKYEIPADAKSFRAVCGNGGAAAVRIVGGEEAVPHSWPWQVGLFIDDQYFCGGSLISDTLVLTAAHCTDGASSFRVVLGSHVVNNPGASTEGGRVEITTTDFVQHKRYSSRLIVNDIALIRLPAPVTFSDVISPVCLPDAADGSVDFVGQAVTPTGWGKPSDAASGISPILRQVTVPVLAYTPCNDVYGVVTANQICIDAANGRGTCNGDSGGPLNYLTSDGTYKTLGITSFGASAGCEVGYPDVFTRVTSYLDWIAAEGLVVA